MKVRATKSFSITRLIHLAVTRVLHEHGWIHRDLSRGNVLVDREGHARLIDFEFAKKCASLDDPEFQAVRTKKVYTAVRPALTPSYRYVGYSVVHGH